MKNRAKIAVAILNWNGEKLLETFLPEVMRNTVYDGAEIYIIDNNSSDNSIEYIKNTFPEVKLVLLDRNYGFAGGYNKGLKQIDADYYVLLNSDVAPGENWLAPLVEKMDNTPEVAACVPKIKSYTQPDMFEYAGAAGGFIDKYGFPYCRGRLFDVLEKDEGQYDESVSVFWGSGAALMIRSEIYNNCRGLDEDFFAHMEEIDLCWRVKNKGFQIMSISQSEVFHLGGGTLNQQNSHKTYLNFRNNLYMLVKNLPRRRFVRRLLLRMILDGVAAVHFLLKGEFGFFAAVAKAHISFYGNFKRMLAKRKSLLPHVVTENHDEMFNGSLVWHFFVKKQRTFRELN
ncbi:MAG: glycosyltransferase family 2 protein [Chlorobi bacterium]|nr:glycosyltransferase family 2 protein [Chlorobiota bacterium]